MTTDFEEYIRQGEPGRRERAYTWRTAIGLQAVDGLRTSDYLKETAGRHIEGDISIDDTTNPEPDVNLTAQACRKPTRSQ